MHRAEGSMCIIRRIAERVSRGRSRKMDSAPPPFVVTTLSDRGRVLRGGASVRLLSLETDAVAVTLLACDESDSRLPCMEVIVVDALSFTIVGIGVEDDLAVCRGAVGVSVDDGNTSVEIEVGLNLDWEGDTGADSVKADGLAINSTDGSIS